MSNKLLTGSLLKATVREVLAAKGSRIVLTAYVGRNPVPLLGPRPEGIELFCWPKLQSTSGKGVKALLEAKVKVRFVENLHAKVYSNVSRAVVGSSNLSDNGFSADAGMETGILVEGLDINSFVDRFVRPRSRLPKPKELDVLEENFKFGMNQKTGRGPQGATKLPSFIEWLVKPGNDVVIGVTIGDVTATQKQKDQIKYNPVFDSDLVWSLSKAEEDLIKRKPRKNWTLDIMFDGPRDRVGDVDLSYCGEFAGPFKYPRNHSDSGRSAAFGIPEKYWPLEPPFRLTSEDRSQLRKWVNRLRKEKKDKVSFQGWEKTAYDSYLHIDRATAKQLLHAFFNEGRKLRG